MANVAWSYSRLKSFEDCPKKFYHLNIARDVKEQPSEAMTAGANDHKHLESRIREGKPLPSHLASMEPVCAAFGAARERGMELLTEQQWAFTRDFQPTDWFSKSVWVRVILDVAAVSKKNALVADWKTGRRDPDWEQLKLFAAALFLQYPVEKVTAQFIWTKNGEVDSEVFHRDDAPAIWEHFIERAARLQHAADTNTWPAQPNRWCGRCAVKLAGLCKGE